MGKVIEAYEGVLALEEQLNNTTMKEQLLFAYLNSIIGKLQNDNTSLEDITLSEQYYRKAVTLIPKIRNLSVSGELQRISRDLLEKKYTQFPGQILQINQTVSSVNQAVYYWESIEPKS